ncbi:MAG: GDP-mannose 4,6-dehydratase [Xenococcaceae cyanobacterium MO_167.B27]|nr:GDP-mannose 4,6-dehydratase [Xenococcaceae cyanobacterium MO_167.B27]
MKTALICGVSGQDGSYLAKLLLEKGYTVYGSSRDAQVSSFRNLLRLGIREQVQVESLVPTDFRSVLQVISKVEPDEIYNLAGQTSVGLSFEQPVETLESIATGTLNFLEVIRFIGAPIKFYNAGSSECFGDIGDRPADESTPFRPRSPYAVAKATAFWQVANYREAYDIFACSGILFNHESPLRPQRFVTQKIVSAAYQISQGNSDKLYLGNISVKRDWGWAPEYVKAMYLMLQQDTADDYVVATGESYSLEELVAQAFNCVGLNWQDHVITDPSLLRPTDLAVSKGNPSKAKAKLGWEAQYKMPEVVKMMIEAY